MVPCGAQNMKPGRSTQTYADNFGHTNTIHQNLQGIQDLMNAPIAHIVMFQRLIMFQFAGGAFVALAADLRFDPFHFSTPRDMKLIFLLNYLLQGGLKVEHKTCDILAAERLRLMRFDNRLIIDSFQS